MPEKNALPWKSTRTMTPSPSRRSHREKAPLLSSGSRQKGAELRKSSASSYEGLDAILEHHLRASIVLLLKASSSTLACSSSIQQTHMALRAEEYMGQELGGYFSSLPASLSDEEKRAAAFARLSQKVLGEMEGAMVDVEPRKHLLALRDSNQQLRNYCQKATQDLHQSAAIKDLRIEELEDSQRLLQAKNATLLKSVELLERDLSKSIRALNDLQRNKIALCMQALDYKAEVDRSCLNFLRQVELRMGFVPRSIEQQLKHISQLKPPGDAKYLEVRGQLEGSGRGRASERSYRHSTRSSSNSSRGRPGNQPSPSQDESSARYSRILDCSGQSPLVTEALLSDNNKQATNSGSDNQTTELDIVVDVASQYNEVLKSE